MSRRMYQRAIARAIEARRFSGRHARDRRPATDSTGAFDVARSLYCRQ